MSLPLKLLPKVSTGIAGLDQLLDGGLPAKRLYLVQGESGAGKTTLGIQFALAGVQAGESVLYITLSETEEEIMAVAASHGWDMMGMYIHELIAIRDADDLLEDQSIFPSSQVELREVTEEILSVVERVQPTRIIFDSINELRMLADTPLRYRRQILAIRNVMVGGGATVLLLDRERVASGDTTLDSLVHGIIALEMFPLDYGDIRRRLRIAKMRGMPFHDGYHDYRIESGGLLVYPRLRNPHPYTHLHATPVQLKSGIAELDTLVGGGMETGTACLIVGQTGTGKTTLATLFAHNAAQQGRTASIFLFEERLDTLFARAAGLGMDLQAHVASGRIRLHPINVGEISPGEFAQCVCAEVHEHGAEIVLIDSLSGYLNAMPQERLLLLQMHDLLAYLGQLPVLTLLTLTQHGMVVESGNDVDMSYLADTVLLVRHFESSGVIRQAISVIKKRYGHHERSIREMSFMNGCIRVGNPLTAFEGILTGNPTFVGATQQLFQPAETGTAHDNAG
jgi:circadian clock protein KaiC